MVRAVIRSDYSPGRAQAADAAPCGRIAAFIERKRLFATLANAAGAATNPKNEVTSGTSASGSALGARPVSADMLVYKACGKGGADVTFRRGLVSLLPDKCTGSINNL